MEPQKPDTITDIIRPELPTIEALLLINNNDPSSIQTIALQELNYLEQHITNKPALLQCTPLSIILAVKNVIRKNLSLDPNAGLVYIKSRNQNIAPYGQPDKWVQVLEIQETANGLISYNRQFGRILDYTNPKVIKNAAGKVTSVTMSILVPSFPAPRWQEHEFDESDFLRWRTYSHKENKKSYKPNKGKPEPDDQKLNHANALYTAWNGGLDPEFARAKCIKHSLKKLGTNPNEVAGGIIHLPKSAPVIDPGIAISEAEDGDFTQHEEINSTINEQTTNPSNSAAPQSADFNAEDL